MTIIRMSLLAALASGAAGCSLRHDSTPAADSAATSATDSRGSTAPAAADPGMPAAAAGILTHYDLVGAPAWQVKLPKELAEISGIAFSPDGRLFAHGDQRATVWQLDAAKGKVLKTFSLAPGDSAVDMGKKEKKHGVTGDFEDMAIVNDRFYLISSTGVLVEFAEGADGASVPFTAYQTGLGESCEIEGLAYEAPSRSLLILCKHSHSDAWKDQVVVLAWSLERKALDPKPRVAVPYARFAAFTKAKSFHGSALALAADGRSMVMVAGPQRVFAEVTMAGEVTGGGALDPSHVQPEGLAFAPDGTLLISDEGAGKRGMISGYSRH